MTSHTLPHAAGGSDKGPVGQLTPPTTRDPVAQAPKTDNWRYYMIDFIKDIKFRDAKYTYHKCYMALNDILIFHGQAMLINGNNSIFTTEAHWFTVGHVGLF